jgi:kynurenine formamidase
VGELAQDLLPATLISVVPEHAAITMDSYAPALEEHDKVISKALLAAELSAYNSELLSALIVRTLPNPQVKMRAHYSDNNPPPFFTRDALIYLKEKGVKHLIVDFPSIDKMHDDGLLTNHHIFWQVTERTHSLSEASNTENTVTEMAYISDAVNDGHYLLSLNIAPFQSDAAPSRPIIYPMELINAV